MTDAPGFRGQLDALELLLQKIAHLTQAEATDRRRELIQCRRELAERIAAIGKAADLLFVGTPLEREFRTLFSNLRSATASHQANWPAVRLGEDSEGFRASARPMRDANRDFISWARAALSAL